MKKHIPHWEPLTKDILDRKLLMRSKENGLSGNNIISAALIDSKTGEIKDWLYPGFTPVEYWTF